MHNSINSDEDVEASSSDSKLKGAKGLTYKVFDNMLLQQLSKPDLCPAQTPRGSAG